MISGVELRGMSLNTGMVLLSLHLLFVLYNLRLRPVSILEVRSISFVLSQVSTRTYEGMITTTRLLRLLRALDTCSDVPYYSCLELDLLNTSSGGLWVLPVLVLRFHGIDRRIALVLDLINLLDCT